MASTFLLACDAPIYFDFSFLNVALFGLRVAGLIGAVAIAKVITAMLNGIFLYRTKNKLGGHTKYNCI